MSNAAFKFGMVVSRFHPDLAANLQEGALQTFLKAGISKESVEIFHVPGTFEIPLLVQRLAVSKKFDAIVALGCVIRGETVHFDLICRTTLASLQKISLESGVPVTSGIVMAENPGQAYERCGGKVANRGAEAARAAIEMIQQLKNI